MEETNDVIADLELLKAEAAGRAGYYDLFSRVFEDVPTEEFLSSLTRGEGRALIESLSELGLDRSLADVIGFPPADTVEVAAEYTTLFEAHNKVYPHGSCWTAEKPRLMAKPWADANEFYLRLGRGLSEDRVFRADHISTELAFLSWIASQVAIAETLEAAGEMQAEYVSFMRDIVQPWVPRFLVKTYEDGRASYYAAWARTLEWFMELDVSLLEEAVEPGV